MQRRCWRWLWIWVGVLVAGCGQLWSSETPAPETREPTLPLFGYTLLPPTLTPSLWPVGSATPLLSVDGISGISPLAMYLAVSGPTCYETPVGSLVCLGQVQNRHDQPVEQVVVTVQLLAQDGTVLASGQALLARQLLSSGLGGPYRVLFDEIPEGYTHAAAYIASGRIAENVERRYAELELNHTSGVFVYDQYQITLSIVNKSRYPAERIVVTMTLLDRDGQVTGYRQVYLDHSRQIQPGETLSVTVKAIPQGPNTVGFTAFAESRPVLN